MAKSRHLGGAHTSVGAPPTAPDFGRRVVALQRQIGQIAERLERADAAAAARSLEAAEADPAVLRGASSDAVANDPNLIALAARLAALKERVE